MILRPLKLNLSVFFFGGFLCCIFGFFTFKSVPAQREDPVQVQLLTSSSTLGQKNPFLFGLEITLQDGWYLYAPQKESSLHPPFFENNRSLNMGNFTLFWPRPFKISKDGLDILVYRSKTIIPFTTTILKTSKEAFLKATLKLVVCNKTQCLPYSKDLSYGLLPGPSTETPSTRLLEDTLKDASLEFPEALKDVKSPFFSFLILLGGAFLGGFILNFMPCILPVLSLKFLSLLKKRSSASHLSLPLLKIRFLMSFLGILTFFCGFSFLSSLGRFFGMHIGWGLQFQNPYFLGGMILLLLLFSLNLWGVFEINLPSFFRTWISTKNKVDQKRSGPQNSFSVFASDYASGLFAALLATPCTAPFLSIALGASLTQNPFTGFLTFLSIGSGFGLPYLLMIFYPKSLYKLPSPGAWMQTFKRLLSLGLVGTALWLTFVLFSPQFSVSENDISWIPFSPQTLEHHLQKGDSVLVDVTAEWCLTCKVNKVRVYKKSSLKHLFKEHKIILIRADWTRSNRDIEHYLKSFGRTAIPFTVYYTPRHPEGVILPELLTPTFLTTLIQGT